jgi:hypothetical protein
VRGLTKYILSGLIAITWAGCDREKKSTSSARAIKAIAQGKDPAKRQDARLAWNRKTLVEAYQTVGNQNSAWDDAAEKLLEAFALTRSGRVDDDVNNAARKAAAAAASAGCDDPMVEYLTARYAPAPADSEPLRYAEKMSAIAEKLNISDYPSIRRFYGCLRAAEASEITIGPDNKLPKRLMDLRYGATTNLLRALDDMTTPVEEIQEAVEQWLPTATRSAR